MPYVLLVIGALMSVAGLYSIVTGYRIVQVEEGWSSVIAGSVLFVGGFLTIGLGLILRTLRDLRGALPAGGAVTPAALLPAEPVAAAASAPVVAPPPPTLPPLASPEPRLETSKAPWSEAPSSEERPEPPPVRDQPAPATPFLAPSPIAMAAPAIPEPPHEPEPPRFDAWEPEPASAYAPPRPPAPEIVPAPAELGAADDDKLETPATAEHDAAATTTDSATPPAAPSDDWLDRTFAAFDQELPKTERKTPPRMPPAPRMPDPETPLRPEPPPFEPAYAEAAPEPAHVAAVDSPPEPPKAPAAAAPPSAIIGRYEADGTTYVMFADGSIEAQSPNGVYRFASMAELKSFIES